MRTRSLLPGAAILLLATAHCGSGGSGGAASKDTGADGGASGSGGSGGGSGGSSGSSSGGEPVDAGFADAKGI
ncbi:MAG TPA: hypothetical protein VHS09_03555 [Polyangiaceae bacterium]|nr:hypothetical protein [Polyangiaceae bacterium]